MTIRASLFRMVLKRFRSNLSSINFNYESRDSSVAALFVFGEIKGGKSKRNLVGINKGVHNSSKFLYLEVIRVIE